MTPVAAAWFAVPFFLLPGFLFNLIAGAKGPRALAAFQEKREPRFTGE